jgi:integrase
MPKQSTIGKLSETKVRQAKGKERAYKLADGGGLYLLVNPNASKYWRLKYRINSKEKSLALGVYPGVSMAEARSEAVKAKELLRQNIDPVIRRRQEKATKSKNTFRNIAKEWHDKQKGRWTEDHAKRIWTSLVNDVLPIIGDMSIKDIQTLDCLSVVRTIEARGALDVASRVKQRIRSVFRYAIQTARCEYNPADQLQGVIETRRVTHMASLKAEALPVFLEQLESYQGHIITKLALKLLIHTFVRPGEIRGACWQEFDLDKKEWRIPAERMKMNDEHIVPLSDQAISILEELEPISGKYKLVFPSVRNIRKPMSENTLTFAIRKRLGFDATAHGFRATASTILNETGFRPDVIERQLAHAERNKVRAAYNRSQYLSERRKMMQWWGSYLEDQSTSRKVVPIRTATG